MSKTVIKVENVSKQYRLGKIGTGSIKHDLNRLWYNVRGKEDPYLKIGEENDRTMKGNSEYVWALKDISFDVKEGEVLGIVGRNGAGKSTLLKILSRTTLPTLGKIKIKGRIASLLEVGTGFHPELSGRENVFLNGAILGMTKNEIQRKFDEIVDFSGVEKYIDTPVKRYSSGMFVRLAFAVAAHLEPEILIVDEVLAVGDAEFRKKCISKMSDEAKLGRTIIFVSHDMAAISLLCSNGVCLKNGKLDYLGKVDQAVKHYFTIDQNINTLNDRIDREGNFALKFTSLELINSNGEGTKVVESGEAVTFKLGYKRNQEVSLNNFLVSLNLYDSNTNVLLSYFASDELGFDPTFTLRDEGFIYYRVKMLPLRGGSYYLSVYSAEVEYKGLGGPKIDCIQRAFEFDVLPVDFWNTGIINRKMGMLISAKITS